MKIINPDKKSDFIVRELHNFSGKFESLLALKSMLINDFEDQVPPTPDFQVGYFLGKQSTKYWLMCEADLQSMYKNIKKSVLLWCDRRADTSKSPETEPLSKNRKRKASSETAVVNIRQQIEKDVEGSVNTLKEKHGSTYSIPQYRLWARMIVAGNHDSLEEPPRIPAITGIVPKREKKESLADAMAIAAATFAKAMQSSNSGSVSQNATNTLVLAPASGSASTGSSVPTVGLSPGRVTELRGKKLNELRELQQLLEQNILSTEEFLEQKSLVLDSLRKLTH